MVKSGSKSVQITNAQLCVLHEFLSAEFFLEPLLDNLHVFLGNPLMYTDHTHRLISCRTVSPPRPIQWSRTIELGYYDNLFMDDFFYDLMSELTTDSQAKLIVQGDLDCLLKPVSFGGIFYGILAVLAQEKPFDEADFRLLDSAADIIAVRSQSGQNLERRQEFLYSRIVTDLLDGTIKTEKELFLRMKTRNWQQKSFNRVILIKTDHRQGTFAQYIETNLLKAELGSKIFTYLGNVVVLEEFDQRPPDILSSALENFLERNKLISGVSDVFFRTMDLPRYYQQARRVVKYSDESNSGTYVSYYDNYKFFDFIRECKDRIDCSNYTHNTVLQLAEYDKENNSDLGRTLYSYLEANRSLALTGELMHLHKNTIAYRIGKIKEMSGLDFSDTEDIIHIYLSYLLA